MLAYFDTSAIVPLAMDEPTTATAKDVWSGSTHGVTTMLAYPEARSALGRARRQARIDDDQLRDARERLSVLLGQLELMGIDHRLADRAGDLAEQQALAGCDAVHLASMEALAGRDAVLVSGDRRLCDAARRLGLAVAQLSP